MKKLLWVAILAVAFGVCWGQFAEGPGGLPVYFPGTTSFDIIRVLDSLLVASINMDNVSIDSSLVINCPAWMANLFTMGAGVREDNWLLTAGDLGLTEGVHNIFVMGSDSIIEIELPPAISSFDTSYSSGQVYLVKNIGSFDAIVNCTLDDTLENGAAADTLAQWDWSFYYAMGDSLWISVGSGGSSAIPDPLTIGELMTELLTMQADSLAPLTLTESWTGADTLASDSIGVTIEEIPGTVVLLKDAVQSYIEAPSYPVSVYCRAFNDLEAPYDTLLAVSDTVAISGVGTYSLFSFGDSLPVSSPLTIVFQSTGGDTLWMFYDAPVDSTSYAAWYDGGWSSDSSYYPSTTIYARILGGLSSHSIQWSSTRSKLLLPAVASMNAESSYVFRLEADSAYVQEMRVASHLKLGEITVLEISYNEELLRGMIAVSADDSLFYGCTSGWVDSTQSVWGPLMSPLTDTCFTSAGDMFVIINGHIFDFAPVP